MNHLNDIKALADLVMGDKPECNQKPADKFEPCEGCPAKDECKAKGCHQVEAYYQEQYEYEQHQFEQQQYEEDQERYRNGDY